MRWSVLLCFLFLGWMYFKRRRSEPIEISKVSRLIKPVLDQLLLCGELADYRHSEDIAGYSFFPLTGHYFKPSYAEVSYQDLSWKNPVAIAHQIIMEWNKNDAIALNRSALAHHYKVLPDGRTVSLINSVKWVGE